MNATIISGMPAGRKRLAIAAAIALLGGVWIAVPYVRAAAFLADLAGYERVAGTLRLGARSIATEDVSIDTRHGVISARAYIPSGSHGAVAVFPGVHRGGVDEPRLDALARRMARSGFTVLSVPVPGLRRFEITSESTDVIEEATRWLADTPRLAPSGRVGVVGVSFSGGLALVAAGRPSLAGRLDAVASIGGYGDLPRALRYLCTGILPDGSTRPPHDYGLAVVALAAVPLLVPPEQQSALARGITTFLDASHDDAPDQREGRRLLADARAQAAQLEEPARTLLTWVTDRDVVHLGPRLEPLLEAIASDPALSPERSRITGAPVFLLHGAQDNVIPSSETPLLATHLQRAGNAKVRHLLTPLVSHAGVTGTPAFGDAWELVRFWKDALVHLP